MKVADLFAALGLEVDRAAFAAADNAIAQIASTTAVATAQVEHFSSVVLGVMRSARTGVDDAVVSWDGLEKKTKRAPINLRNVAIGLTAVGFAARSVIGFFGSVVEEFDHLGEVSQRTGVAVEELQALGYAASFSGVDIDTLATSLGKFQKNAVAAANGSKAAREAFADAGVNAEGLADGSISTEEALMQLADTFSTMEDGAAKSAMAQAVLGRSGTALIPVLNAGREGVKQYTDEARRMGLVLGGEDVAAMEALDDQLTTMKGQWKAIKIQITRALLPAFRAIIEVLSLVAKHFELVAMAALSLAGAFAILKAGSVAAAWASLKAWLAALAPLVLMALALFALILIVEDLYRWFTDGDSLLKDVWNEGIAALYEKFTKFFGWLKGQFDSAAEWIADTVDSIPGLGGAKRAASESVADIFRAPGSFLSQTSGISPDIASVLPGGAGAPVVNNNTMQPTINITAPPGVSAQDIANLTRTALGEWYDEEKRALGAQTGGGL